MNSGSANHAGRLYGKASNTTAAPRSLATSTKSCSLTATARQSSTPSGAWRRRPPNPHCQSPLLSPGLGRQTTSGSVRAHRMKEEAKARPLTLSRLARLSPRAGPPFTLLTIASAPLPGARAFHQNHRLGVFGCCCILLFFASRFVYLNFYLP
jgi:hypothetical protein